MSKSTFRIKGWHVLASLIAFFGLVIGVNTIFIVKATRTFPGMSVERPFEKGLRYNQTLKARQQTQQEGWAANFSLEDSNDVVVQFTNEAGPIDGLNVTVHLVWPGLPHQDQMLTLKPSGPGVYKSPMSGLVFHGRTLEFEGQAVRLKDNLVFPFKGRIKV